MPTNTQKMLEGIKYRHCDGCGTAAFCTQDIDTGSWECLDCL